MTPPPIQPPGRRSGCRASLTFAVLVFYTGHDGRGETLQQAWAAAERGNGGLAAARLEAAAAGYGASAAASERVPTASLRTGAAHRSDTPSFVGSQPTLGAPSFALPFAQRNAGVFAARARYPLWTGGRIENSVAAANSRHAAAEGAAAWSAMRLRVAVAEAYLGLLRQRASLAAARASLAAAAASEADTAELARQNRALDSQVLGARVARLEAGQRLLVNENAVAAASAAYNHLLGRPCGTTAEVCLPQIPAAAGDLEQLVAAGVRHRPDLAELARTAAAHTRDAAGWRAARRPQVAAEVGFDYEQNRFQSPEGIGLAQIVVDWDFADGGKRRRMSRSSRAKAAAASALLRESISRIEVEVLRALHARTEARGAERIRYEALDQELERYRLAHQRYQRGRAVASEAIAAHAAVARRRATLTHAQADLVLAELRLQLVTGLIGAGGQCGPAENRLGGQSPE